MISDVSPFIRVVNTEMGLGVQALQDLPAGTRLIYEEPFLQGPSVASLSALLSDDVQEIIAARLTRQLKKQSPEHQREFQTLTNAFPSMIPIVGTFRSNVIFMGQEETDGGLFITACRINHSCAPNCSSYWSTEAKRIVVYTLTEIKKGDEITIHYVWSPSSFTSLQKYYGFVCKCQVCTLDEPARAASKLAHSSIGGILLTARLCATTDPLVGLEHAKNALEMIDREKMLWLKTKAYIICLQICAGWGVEEGVKSWAAKIADEYALAGEGYGNEQAMRHLAQNPSAIHIWQRLGTQFPPRMDSEAPMGEQLPKADGVETAAPSTTTTTTTKGKKKKKKKKKKKAQNKVASVDTHDQEADSAEDSDDDAPVNDSGVVASPPAPLLPPGLTVPELLPEPTRNRQLDGVDQHNVPPSAADTIRPDTPRKVPVTEEPTKKKKGKNKVAFDENALHSPDAAQGPDNDKSQTVTSTTLSLQEPLPPYERSNEFAVDQSNAESPPSTCLPSSQDIGDGPPDDKNQLVNAYGGMEAPGPAPPLSTTVPLSDSEQTPYPLKHTWTLYHDCRRRSPQSGPDFSSMPESEIFVINLTTIGSFDSVPGFCSYFNWLKKPSQLNWSGSYYLFKDGIRPVWEDLDNVKGAKWVLSIKSQPGLLDRSWLWLAMALVGEQIDEDDVICGTVVSLRKVDRIQVWTRQKDDVEQVRLLGRKLVDLLEIKLNAAVMLEYQPHSSYRTHNHKAIDIVSQTSKLKPTKKSRRAAVTLPTPVSPKRENEDVASKSDAFAGTPVADQYLLPSPPLSPPLSSSPVPLSDPSPPPPPLSLLLPPPSPLSPVNEVAELPAPSADLPIPAPSPESLPKPLVQAPAVEVSGSDANTIQNAPTPHTADPTPIDETPTSRAIVSEISPSIEILSGKEFGVNARTDIPAGTRLLCEEPIFVIQRDINLDAIRLNRELTASDDSRTVAVTVAVLEKLSTQEQRRFFTLRSDRSRKRIHPVLKILESNSGAIDDRFSGVFATLKRFNHSCAPNCEWTWRADLGRAVVYTLRDVRPGDALTISYNMQIFESPRRQAYLKSHFSFTCACEVCSLEGSAREASDKARVELMNILNTLHTLLVTNPVFCLKMGRKGLDIVTREKIPGVHRTIFYDLFQLCVAWCDAEHARYWALKGAEEYTLTEGRDSPNVERMLRLADDPEKWAAQDWGLTGNHPELVGPRPDLSF